MTVTPALAETCVKCNVCTSACPVAAATDLFLGPKAVGPQAERFRHPRADIPDASLSWCSGCGVCSRVCPHEVPIAELNVQAKARLALQRGVSLRDQMLARPAMLARLAAPLAPIANVALHAAPARFLAEIILGVSRSAPLPAFSQRTFRSREMGRRMDLPPAGPRPTVAYFHGCSVDHYEPFLGDLLLRIFDVLGYDVCLPPQGCCGIRLR